MRHISLLLKNGTNEDLVKIKEWCKNNEVGFEYRYSKNGTYLEKFMKDEVAPLYYFYIIGNTNDYINLQNVMNNKLLTTDYADICNVADLDDNFEIEFSELINDLQSLQNKESVVNRKFIDFIMPIKDVNLLKEIERYSGRMTTHQRQMLRDRIDIVSGKRKEVEEEFTEGIMALHTNIKDIRKKAGMNRKEFCDYLKIPYRTVEDWENKKSSCSTYLYELIVFKLKTDGLL